MPGVKSTDNNLKLDKDSFRKRSERCILEKLVQSTVIENSDIISSKLKDGDIEVLEIPISKLAFINVKIKRFDAFNRIKLLGHVKMIESGNITTIVDPLEFLLFMKCCWLPVDKDDKDEENFLSFCKEIENCIRNLTEFEYLYEHNRKEILNDCPSDIKTSLDFVINKRKTEEGFSSLIFYEQQNIHGHPMHPGAKCRMGFSLSEIKDYSPEFKANVSLVIVAIEKTKTAINIMPGLKISFISDFLFHDFPWLKEEIESEMNSRNLDFGNYDYFPVHPWQLEHVILSDLFTSSVQNSNIIPLQNITIVEKPLTSVRSLAVANDKGHSKYHFKVPLNILITSDIRLISPRETESGPKVSAMLQNILETADFPTGKFRIQKEVVGAYYDTKEDTDNHKLARNLCCIAKENPELNLNEHEFVMPASALIEKSPASNKLVLVEVIEKYMKCHCYSKIDIAALSFFEQYLSLGMKPIMTLLSRYGVALEAHLQNSLIIFHNDGYPITLIIRDFSDIRLSKERLAKQGYSLNFKTVTKSHVFGDIDEVRANVIHAYLQNHIGELVICLSQQFSIPEHLLWRNVKKQFQRVFHELKQDENICDQVAEDEITLFQPEISVKALTRMRVLGTCSEYLFVNVPNPLNSA